jgi:hypothetical protein
MRFDVYDPEWSWSSLVVFCEDYASAEATRGRDLVSEIAGESMVEKERGMVREELRHERM